MDQQKRGFGGAVNFSYTNLNLESENDPYVLCVHPNERGVLRVKHSNELTEYDCVFVGNLLLSAGREAFVFAPEISDNKSEGGVFYFQIKASDFFVAHFQTALNFDNWNWIIRNQTAFECTRWVMHCKRVLLIRKLFKLYRAAVGDDIYEKYDYRQKFIYISAVLEKSGPVDRNLFRYTGDYNKHPAFFVFGVVDLVNLLGFKHVKLLVKTWNEAVPGAVRMLPLSAITQLNVLSRHVSLRPGINDYLPMSLDMMTTAESAKSEFARELGFI